MIFLTEIFDGTALIIYLAIGFIGLLILGATIATAMQVTKRNRLMTAQIKLLVELALRQGVERETIKIILNKTAESDLKMN